MSTPRGYDFRYRDEVRKLSGQPGALCLIEVKANAKEMGARISLARHQWGLAEECSRSEDRVFIVLRVQDRREVGRLSEGTGCQIRLWLAHYGCHVD